MIERGERQVLSLSKFKINSGIDAERVPAGEIEDRRFARRFIHDEWQECKIGKERAGAFGREAAASFTQEEGVSDLEPEQCRNDRFIGGDCLDDAFGVGGVLVIEGLGKDGGDVGDECQGDAYRESGGEAITNS